MPTVKDIYQLPKASRYANPRGEGDILRLVYGDLTTGGAGGVWPAVCIDTVNRVYALAGHAILSAAAGNSVSVYNKDGQALAGYTFNEANDYESQGAVATISFPTKTATTISFDSATNSINDSAGGLALLTNCMVVVTGSTKSQNNTAWKITTATASQWLLDGERKVETEAAGASITLAADQQQNEPLAVRAKGLASAGALVTNPITALEDFLLTRVGMSSEDLDATALERARRSCAGQGYAIAGVLDKDQEIGQTLSEVLACFLGSWRRGPDGKLVLAIDLGLGAWSEDRLAGIIGSHEMAGATFSQDLADVCNRAAVDYCYNHVTSQYEAHDDGAASQDTKSQAIYGDRVHQCSWPWVRSDSVRATLQALVVGTYAYPLLKVEVAQPGFGSLLAMPGDVVLASSRQLMDRQGQAMINQVYRVMSAEKMLDQPGVRLVLLDTGGYKSPVYLADGSVVANGSIVIGGRDTVEV